MGSERTVTTLTCKYSCSMCGLVKAIVEIPVRAEEQSVTDWMEKVCTPALCSDHAQRSPDCHP
jgi:hypothetical protein